MPDVKIEAVADVSEPTRCCFCGHLIDFDYEERQWLDATSNTHFCIGAKSHKNRHVPQVKEYT